VHFVKQKNNKLLTIVLLAVDKFRFVFFYGLAKLDGIDFCVFVFTQHCAEQVSKGYSHFSRTAKRVLDI